MNKFFFGLFAIAILNTYEACAQTQTINTVSPGYITTPPSSYLNSPPPPGSFNSIPSGSIAPLPTNYVTPTTNYVTPTANYITPTANYVTPTTNYVTTPTANYVTTPTGSYVTTPTANYLTTPTGSYVTTPTANYVTAQPQSYISTEPQGNLLLQNYYDVDDFDSYTSQPPSLRGTRYLDTRSPLGKPLLGKPLSPLRSSYPIPPRGIPMNEPPEPRPPRFGMPTYLFPGLVGRAGRVWVGSDYLYNLQPSIGVVIDVITPDGKPVFIDRGFLHRDVQDIFNRHHINPQAEEFDDRPPLPFFRILIMAYPIDNKIVASISGSLFEASKPERLEFDVLGTWQAITWEKHDLIIVSAPQFPEQLKLCVEGIAEAFSQRLRYYHIAMEENDLPNILYPPPSDECPPPPPPKNYGTPPRISWVD